MKDFFISYNKADRQWAEWIAWQLEDEGYSVVIQCWDFLPGCNFVLDMHEAAKDAERTIGVLSPHFLASMFTQPEWSAAFVKDPTGKNRKLLLIRVHDCQPDGLLAAINYLDLVGLDEDTARKKILASAGDKRLKPSSPPGFPGDRTASGGPRFPGALPPIWNVPHLRNPNFTGREQMLSSLHAALNSGLPGAWIQVLTGLGGKGKTSLVREFAYRYHPDYDLIWWVRADEPATLSLDYAALAAALDLPQKDSPEQVVNAVKFWLGQNQKWLLIFDNAQDPDVLKRFLPQGGDGHVLITSRNPNWGSMARVQPLEVFKSAEAVEFIIKRTKQNDEAAAKLLAEETGRLPLALEQAAAYVEETGISLSDYLIRFKKHRKAILERGKPMDYPDTVATTWEMSFQAIKEKSLASADLLNLFSFLAPDDIPRSLIIGGTKVIPEPLASTTADEFKFDNVMAELRRYSLISGTGDIISVHQLVQAVTRDRLMEEEQKKWSEVTLRLISDAFPREYLDNPEAWPDCALLLPHAIAAAAYSEGLGVGIEVAGYLLNGAGLYLRMRAQFIEAKSILEKALMIGRKAYGLGHPNVAAIFSNLGSVLQDLGEMHEARKCFEEALKIDEKVFGPYHPNVATKINNLGSLLQGLGELQEARKCFERALQIDEKADGKDHPNVAIRVNNLGMLLQELGELQEAKKCLERALQIDEKFYGQDHPNVARDINNLGMILNDLGEPQKARKCLERSLQIDERIFGPNHPCVATRINNLGLALMDIGELEEAEKFFERALRIDEVAFGQDHPRVALDVNNLGTVLLDLGEMETAKSCFERSIRILQKFLGDGHPLTRKVMANLDALNSHNL